MYLDWLLCLWAIYVMYGLRLFFVVLQELQCLPNCLHVSIIRVIGFYHFTKFVCLHLQVFEIDECIALGKAVGAKICRFKAVWPAGFATGHAQYTCVYARIVALSNFEGAYSKKGRVSELYHV